MSFYNEGEKNSKAITIVQMTQETSNEKENLSPLGYQITPELGVFSWTAWANLSQFFCLNVCHCSPAPAQEFPSLILC